MNITRDNYEAWFLDYHEGNLSEDQMMELLDFLVINPDLTEEFKSFEMISLDEEKEVVFAEKDFLKKPFDTSIKGKIEEKHLIAWHEGDLNEEEKSAVNRELAKNPQLRKSFALFGMIRLEADNSVVFPDKHLLKKYVLGGYGTYIRQFAAAAAILAIMATLYFMLPDITSSTDHIAQSPVQERSEDITVHEENPAETPAPTAPETTVNSLPSRQNASVRKENQPVQPPVQAAPRVQLAQLNTLDQASLQVAEKKPEAIDSRKEFFWLTYSNGLYEEEEEELQPEVSQTRSVSLATLAYNGLEKRTGIKFNSIEKSVNQLGIWDIAGMGLAGIGQLTGTSLTIDRENDENGKIRSLGIGERFKIGK
jgi:hypothetical protein